MTRRFAVALVVTSAVLVGASMVSLTLGPMETTASEVWAALVSPGTGDPTTVTIVREIRLPRLVTACVAGWGLALAGLCFQSLLKNALASEYTLGVASGASLGAVAGAVLGFTGTFAVSAGAFVGAIATIAIVLLVAHASFSFETHATILAGIIFTSLANAILSLLLTLVSPNQLQSFFFWFLGSFASATWEGTVPVAIATAILSAGIFGFGWQMNAIAVNEDLARQVGISVKRTKLALYGVASLLTALIVSIAGTIGFVGLVVPHLARLVVGADNRRLIPLVAVMGAALCVVSDLIARTMLSPTELPVGVVTALVGVPVFVLLMQRRPR